MSETESYSHQSQPITGVLITNLGTPDEPTPKALRRYLNEFLWDPRIVDLPRPIWWVMLQVILLLRPKRSAQAYKKVWTDEGSPLLAISKKQLEAIRAELGKTIQAPVVVALGMRYGKPSIASALNELQQANVQRVIVLPLYPQYSCSTTASTFDAIAAAVKKWRWLPEFRFINSYHDNDKYIQALADSIQEAWAKRSKPQKLLMSFHGTPKRFLTTGDPYYCQCHKTARLLAEKLELGDDEWMLTFQSIFGREEWLQPYTIETLRQLPNQGVNNVDIVCPGFSADCLETLEEIEEENRLAFIQAGGEQYHYIPALNDRPDHIETIVALIKRNTQDWFEHGGSLENSFDNETHKRLSQTRQQRAIKKGAKE